MDVKFTVDYDLIELVDAIGLDYEIVDRQSNLFDEYKELVIEVNDVEELIETEDLYYSFTDEELCEYLLSPTLCEGLIYTQRIYD